MWHNTEEDRAKVEKEEEAGKWEELREKYRVPLGSIANLAQCPSMISRYKRQRLECEMDKRLYRKWTRNIKNMKWVREEKEKKRRGEEGERRKEERRERERRGEDSERVRKREGGREGETEKEQRGE